MGSKRILNFDGDIYSNITIKNCDFIKQGKYGIVFSGDYVSDVEIYNNLIDGEYDPYNPQIGRNLNICDAITVATSTGDIVGSNNIHIYNNKISNVGHGCIGFDRPTINSVIEFNDINGDTSPYCRAFGVSGVDEEEAVIVRNNNFHDLNVQNQIHGYNVKVYNNIFKDTWESVLHPERAHALGISVNTGAFHNISILNNTFDNTYSEHIRIGYGGDFSNLLIKNNIFLQSSTENIHDALKFEVILDDPDLATIEYNYFDTSESANIMNDFTEGSAVSRTLAQAETLFTGLANNLSGSLTLNDNLSIPSGSDVLNVGELLNDVAYDYRRLPRPQDNNYDIGAYEYGDVLNFTGVTIE